MGDLALSNLGGVGALPGLSLQFVMELLAGLFSGKLAHWRFFDCIPFFWWQLRAVTSPNYHGGASWRCRYE